VFEKTDSCKKGIHFGFLEWTLVVTFPPSNNRRQSRWTGQLGGSHSHLNAGFGADALFCWVQCLQYYRMSVSRDWVMRWSGE
jgi:hypothetical protein